MPSVHCYRENRLWVNKLIYVQEFIYMSTVITLHVNWDFLHISATEEETSTYFTFVELLKYVFLLKKTGDMNSIKI